MADPYLLEWALRSAEGDGLKPLAKNMLRELNLKVSNVQKISAALAQKGFSRNKIKSVLNAAGNLLVQEKDVLAAIRKEGVRTTHKPRDDEYTYGYFPVAISARQRSAIMEQLGRDCLGNKLTELYADLGRISLESVGINEEIMPTMLAFSSEQLNILSLFQKHHGLQFTRSVVVRSAIEELIEEKAPQFKKPPNWQPALLPTGGRLDPHKRHGFVLIKPAYSLLKDACKYTDYDIDYLCSVAIKQCSRERVGNYWIPYRRWTKHPTTDVQILLPQSAHNKLLELVSLLRVQFLYYTKYRPDESTVLMAALLQTLQEKRFPVSVDPYPQEIIDNWRAIWDW